MRNSEKQTDSSTADQHTIKQLIPALRDNLLVLSQKLQSVIDSFSSQDLIPHDLIAQSITALTHQEELQKQLLEILQEKIPGCEERSYEIIEQLLSDAEQQLDLCSVARKALYEFQTLETDHETGRKVLKQCKENALRLASETDSIEFLEKASAYLLFSDIVKNPSAGANLVSDQEELIEAQFPRPLPRLLYSGHIFINNAFEPVEPTDNDLSDLSQDDTIQTSNQENNFTFSTEKEGSQLIATSFVREIGKKTGPNHWTFYMPYGLKIREYLLAQAVYKILTPGQVNALFFEESPGDVEAVIKKMEKDGFITRIQNPTKVLLGYCLSPKGARIFTTQKSRELFIYDGTKVPELLTSMDFAETPNVIPQIISSNWIALVTTVAFSNFAYINVAFNHFQTESSKVPYINMEIRNNDTGFSRSIQIFHYEGFMSLTEPQQSLKDSHENILVLTTEQKTIPPLPHIVKQGLFAQIPEDFNEVITFFTPDGEKSCLLCLLSKDMLSDEDLNLNNCHCHEVEEVGRDKSNPLAGKVEEEDDDDNFPDSLEELAVAANPMVEPKPWKDMSASEKAAELLSGKAYSTDKFVDLVETLIQEGSQVNEGNTPLNSLAQAVVLLKALSYTGNPAYTQIYDRIRLATDFPIDDRIYNANNLMSLFDSGSRPVLHLATLLRAMFAPSTAYDYTLQAHVSQLFSVYDNHFGHYPILKNLYNLLLQINDFSPQGFSREILQQFSNQEAKAELLKQIKETAERLYDEPNIKVMIRGIPKMKSLCFGDGSNLRLCMDYIRNDNRDQHELVLLALEEFCTQNDNSELSISEDKIERKIDQLWKRATTGERTRGMDLSSTPREKILTGFRERLEVSQQWLNATAQKITPTDKKYKQLMKLRNQILHEIQAIIPVVATDLEPYDRTIVTTLLRLMERRLIGRIAENYSPYHDFLRTGYFSVDQNGIPILFKSQTEVNYFEPWRNALKHIASPINNLEQFLHEVTQTDSDNFDNIGKAIAVRKYLNEHCEGNYAINAYDEDVRLAQLTAKKHTEDFKNELELNFAYGRISENLKEILIESLNQFEDDILTNNDFGLWRGFLDALRLTIRDAANKRHSELQHEIESRRRSESKYELVEVLNKAQSKLSLPVQNFVVAEEYINRFDAGITDELIHSVSEEGNAFVDFISDNNFASLFSLCQRNQSLSLKKFGLDYVEQALRRRNISAQYQESSRNLLRNLPNRPEEATGDRIQNLLSELGLSVRRVSRIQSQASTFIRFSAEITPDQKDKAEYAHPVDIMGTKLRSPLDVVCLFGKLQANDIVDKVCGLELSSTSIVLMNGALDLAARRQIAERFHREKSGQNPFLLIDWVLLLHLALHQKTERLPVLLNCTLPYTSSFKPFVTSGAVSDEMFIGRKKELNQILDHNGPVIVYGGRQLGKTALLVRAKSRSHRPDSKEYAVYVSLSQGSEVELVESIIFKLNEVGLTINKCKSIKELANELKILYNKKQWTRLILLIDEADKFLESISNATPAYGPLVPLVNLKRETQNDFKFVLAGLHNVCRAASDPNTIFGQLGRPLCIKPLTSVDALQLLAKPLRYLGFRVENTHLEHILVNTIYYPGIIHFVGYKIVENLSTRFSDYYQAAKGHPPYDLTDKQLGRIMNSADLNNSINERIRWTLEVDSRYFMLARCIAILYYCHPERIIDGFISEQIQEIATILEVKCLTNLSLNKYNALLVEMVDMGILVETTPASFRLRQRRFLEAIGSSSESIERDISMTEESAE